MTDEFSVEMACTGAVFSPKGWECSAQDNALGMRPITQPYPSSPKGWDGLSQPFGLAVMGYRFGPFPRAAPWAEHSQPFGLKARRTGTGRRPMPSESYGPPARPLIVPLPIGT